MFICVYIHCLCLYYSLEKTYKRCCKKRSFLNQDLSYLSAWHTRSSTGLCDNICQHGTPEAAQGFVIAEKEILLCINNFLAIRGLSLLIAIYYIFFIGYPKSVPAQGFLLFIQEVFLGKKDKTVKRRAKYTGFVNSLLEQH